MEHFWLEAICFFGPGATREAITERDKVGGKFDVGILGSAYEALDELGIGGGRFDMSQTGLRGVSK